MSILLALSLAAAAAGDPDMEARGKAFVTALLASDSTETPPYARPAIKYSAYGSEKVSGRSLPVVENSLAGFRKVLRGCTIDLVHVDDGSSDYKIRVFVAFDCPNDLAHANNELALNLVVLNGEFAEADLQIGSPVPMIRPNDNDPPPSPSV